MKTITRFAFGAAAAVFAGALAAAPALAQETKPEAAEAAAPAAPALTEYDASTVVATVGERKVTLGDLIRARQELPPQMQALPPEVLFEGLLEQLVRQAAFAQAAETAGFAEKPDVAAAIEGARNDVLAQAYLEDALRKQYEKLVADGALGLQVSARHILVETQEAATEVKAEIDGGADFAEVAKAKSIGPSGPNGGDLGFFSRGQMVPEFADVAFSLEPGTVSEPVKTDFGWHVIKVEERRQGEAPSFEVWVGTQGQGLIGETIDAEFDKLSSEVGVERPEQLPPPGAIAEEALLAQ